MAYATNLLSRTVEPDATESDHTDVRELFSVSFEMVTAGSYLDVQRSDDDGTSWSTIYRLHPNIPANGANPTKGFYEFNRGIRLQGGHLRFDSEGGNITSVSFQFTPKPPVSTSYGGDGAFS